MTEYSETFITDPEFCTTCGSILPITANKSYENYCRVCHFPVPIRALTALAYVIHFNEPDVYSKQSGLSASGSGKKGKGKKKQEEEDGPVVNRECRNCGNKKMSYATLQLRSADEGQTVFYTCTKCKFKETENS